VREGWLEETLQVASEIAGAQGVERLSAGVVEHDVRLAAFEDSGFRPIVRETLYIRRGGQVSMPDERLGVARLFSVRDTLAMLRLFTVAIPAVVRQQLSTPEQLLNWMRSRYAVVVRSKEEIQVAIGVRQRSDLGHAVVQLWMTEQGVAMGPLALDAVVERLRREGFEAVWLVVPEYDEKAAEVARYVHFAPVTERLQMLRHTTALVRQPAFQRLSESVKGKGVQVAEGPTLSARPLRPTVHAAVCNSQRSARDRVRSMAGRVR
jgi:hypothetical protein